MPIITTFPVFSFFLIHQSSYIRNLMTLMTQNAKNGVRTPKKLCHDPRKKRGDMTQNFLDLQGLFPVWN